MADHAAARLQMVERQLKARGIGDPAVLAAMGVIPRERFVPAALAGSAYEDGPLAIGGGQTISQPYVVALMVQAADLSPGARVLEVGAGSGYAAAVLSRIAGEVFAVERHEALARVAQLVLHSLGYNNVEVIGGDGSGGLPGKAPFDAIIVSASGDHIPEQLKRQLKIGGRLIIPVGGEDVQQLLCVTRIGVETWRTACLGGVRFVPLVGAHGRRER